MDRRTFNTLVLGALGGLSAGGLEACKSDIAPVVIVGAGLAGMHCAYRLHKAGVPFKVYEAADRVGGRTFTGRDLFADGQNCELGGELIDTNHLTMWALSEELGLQLDDRFADLAPSDPREQNEAEGELISDEVIVEQYTAVAPAIFAAFEAAESDDDEYARLDELSLRDFLDQVVGASVHPELYSVLDSAYRGEFGLEIEQQSCLNLVYLIDSETPDPFRIFGDSDERYHTHLGNDSFTTKMADAIGAANIQLETKLTGVSGDKKSGYILTFDGPNGEEEVVADHVVLALPFRLLRECTLEALSPDKKALVDTLGFGTNAKVMGGFSRAVWKTDHGQTGSLTTDARVQQTWDSSIGQAGDSAILTNFLGGETGLLAGDGTAEQWFTSVLPDLERVWPGAEAAYTAGSAVRMHWPTYAFTKMSYTCYLPGQWATWATEGEREGNLHFCGESCSLDFQGWMEGAAETGGLVAAEILADLNIPLDEAGLRALGPKMLLPQACYRADRSVLRAQRPLSRRRAVAAEMARLLGK